MRDKLARSLGVFFLWALPAMALAGLAAFIASPQSPQEALAPAFLPVQAALLVLAPVSFWLTWERHRAPVHWVLPACFSLFILIVRLVLDAWGMTLLLMPGKVRADLAWTEWPLLLSCWILQSLLLWLFSGASSRVTVK